MKIQHLLPTVLLLSSITATAQIGGFKDKLKDKAKDNKNIEVTKPAETPSSAANKKDADGYIIDDPEVQKLFEGKTVYFCTDFALFGSVLNTSNSFKMAGVAVKMEGDNMELLPVGQKQYGGIYKADVLLKKGGNGLFSNGNNSKPLYASIESDGSILLFNGLRAELLSANEQTVKGANKAELEKKSVEKNQLIKAEKAQQKDATNLKENETFFKSGGVASVKKDATLETQFLKVLNDANNLPTVPEKDRAAYKKVMLIFTDWTVEKNALDQPVKMVYAAWAEGNYTADKICFFQKVYFKKDYQGGGVYGPVRFDEAQKPSVVGCELMK
jgi:hypothetical protein